MPSADLPFTQLSLSTFAKLGLMMEVDWFWRHGVAPNWWQRPRLRLLRWMIYGWGIWLFMKDIGSQADFIYFQF